MERIWTLYDLGRAVGDKRAVVIPSVPSWSKPKPAAVMMNLPGRYLLRLMGIGMFIYDKKV